MTYAKILPQITAGNFSAADTKSFDMSIFAIAAAAAGGWIYTAKALSMKEIASTPHELATNDYSKKAPVQGYWQPFHKMLGSSQISRGQFDSVIEDRDERGAPIWIVQYSDGARTIQYHDPRKLL